MLREVAATTNPAFLLEIIHSMVCQDQGFPMSQYNTKQVVLVATNPTESPAQPEGGLNPLLVYGGVSVAVIFALAYFSQTLLDAIAKLFKTTNKQNK